MTAASLDMETYSEAGFTIDPHTGRVRGQGPQGKGGLPVCGTPAYAEHPSAEVLCLYYDLHDGRGVRGWFPGAPDPSDLLDHVRGGGLVVAWNVTFEFWMWNMVMTRKWGWPPLTLEQCRCDMAKSRRFSLPGSLAGAAKVLGTPGKDKEGGRLIQKLTRPHTPTKNRPATRWTPATAWPDFVALYKYCGQDVVAEDAAAARIPDLTPGELRTWQVDQTINLRGIRVDTEALDAALDILGQAERKYTRELATLTGGAVGSVSEVAKLLAWLGTQGVQMPNLQKDTVAEWLNGDTLAVHGHAPWRALQIRATLGAANVKKLHTLRLQVSSDGRLRNQYTYNGAATGRASAMGVQLQNLSAKGPASCECESCGRIFGAVGDCARCGSHMYHTLPDWTVDGAESLLADIATRDLATVESHWGDPVAALGGVLRALFVASPGKKFICVDFSAIEAVVAACISRCQWRIDAFNAGNDIYLTSAAQTTGTSYAEYVAYRDEHGAQHKDRKDFKIKELALGFGGWINAIWAFGGGDGQSDEEVKQNVLAWRAASPEIVEMWGGQFKWCGPGKWDYRPELHGLEGCAIKAIRQPGEWFTHTDIRYIVQNDILYCRLPSGRFLHYHRPRLSPTRDKLNRGPAVQITFEGHNSNAVKGAVGWFRLETWGPRMFENCVQAIAADLQFGALSRCELAGYPIVLHTHDEGVAEVPGGFGSIEQMAAIMTERPEWASWWPIKGDGWTHTRYQK